MPNRWIETLKDGYKYPTPSPSSDQQGKIVGRFIEVHRHEGPIISPQFDRV